jgi:cobalamin biosynthesis Mg chelatase CobN
MHLLATTSTNLDEIVEAVDLGQPPGEIVVLSFADSDLAGLAAAWEAERTVLPSVRLAHLRDLRHPMSVDLWIDRVAAHARVIVVRLLGGLDWWRYGIERLSALARERGIKIATMPGSPPPRRCHPRSWTRCSASSAKAAARICAPCCAPLPATPGTRSRRRGRGRCRASPATCRAKAQSMSAS